LISGYFRACGSYRGFFDRVMMQINKVATEPRILNDLIFWCLTPLSAIFQLYFVNNKKGALDSQPQMIKRTSCLPMVGGSLRLLPPLKLVAMI
jgi:hypothetical protein